MSNFHHKIYVPTGIAENINFTQVSGYCYEKINENVTITNDIIHTNLFGDYQSCEHCNSCECGKNIDFIVGGFLHTPNAISFTQKTISIKTSSTGWQEIAIESGQLNINPSTQLADENYNFKPTQIYCFDRKINFSSGIHVSFEERNAEISHFKFASGVDLYERQDLYFESTTGAFGDLPSSDYLNQYDKVNVANTIRTIKFYNNCDFECPTQDIFLRLHGNVNPDGDDLATDNTADANSTTWRYIECTGVSTTPGEVINYELEEPMDFSKIVTGSLSGAGISAQYPFHFDSIDVVNKDILLGNEGSDLDKKYSVTGQYHFEEEWLGKGYASSTTTYYLSNSGYIFLENDDIDYSRDISKYLLDYSIPPNCFDTNISSDGSTFNQYYRILGGGPILVASPEQGSSRGEYYTGCFQSSDFIDGKYKNGTMMPMYWTGIITGNADGYTTFIDDEELTPPSNWQTGFYVYQWYPSGNQAQANSLTGFFGLANWDSENLENQKHYKSTALNQTPINLQNNLKIWSAQSGNFPDSNAEAINASFSIQLEGGSAQGANYNYIPFEFYESEIRHEEFDGENMFSAYSFAANQGELANLNEPEYQHNTFLVHGKTRVIYPIYDRAGSEWDSNIPEENNPQYSQSDNHIKLNSIQFQLSWDK
jgi:hypothetical protein